MTWLDQQSDAVFVTLVLSGGFVLLLACQWAGVAIGRYLGKRHQDWIAEGKGPMRW